MSRRSRNRADRSRESSRRQPPAVERPGQPLAPPPDLNRIAAASALVALGVYVATLNPTVFHGDSGEMISVAYTLGVAHPPGFPLYAILAKLAALLPFGSVAWRVNLFSAVSSAAAAFFLCRAVARWTGSAFPGILAAGAFAFSSIVWPYAVTAEVFALNNLFVALLLDLTTGLALATEAGHGRRRIALIAFVFALGLANHQILLLLAGPPVLWLVAREVVAHRASLWPVALGAVAGLLPYLYLFVAPHFGSEIVWGDTTSPSGWLAHILRSEYGTFQLGSRSPTASFQALGLLLAFARLFARSTLWVGPLLALAAIPALGPSTPLTGVLRAWAVGLVGHLAVFTTLSHLSMSDPVHAAVQQRFWQQAVLLLAAFMGLGLAHLARLPLRSARPLAAVLALGLPTTLVLTQYRAMDQSGHVFFRSYGKAILDSLPRRAVLVITSDEAIGSVRYLQQVEGWRRDVRVLPAGQLASPWFRLVAERSMSGLRFPPASRGAEAFTFHAFLDVNLPRARVFLVNRVPWEQTLEEAYALWPVGLADEVLPRDASPPLAAWVAQASDSFARFDPADRRGHDGAWERYVEQGYWKQVDRFGLALTRAAAHAENTVAAARLVTGALEPLLERHPSPPRMLMRNLGVAYQFLAQEQPGARVAMRRWWRRYLDATPASDPDRALIEEALESRTP